MKSTLNELKASRELVKSLQAQVKSLTQRNLALENDKGTGEWFCKIYKKNYLATVVGSINSQLSAEIERIVSEKLVGHEQMVVNKCNNELWAMISE